MSKRNILIIAFCFSVSVMFGWESYANENAESLYNQAKSLYREKEYHQSMAVLQKIIEKYPDSEVSVKAEGAIVDCHRIMKNYDIAIEYGNKYLKDYPDNDFAVNVELIIARSLLRKEEYDEAGNKYKEFINKHQEGSDKLAEAYYFLGSCYEERTSHFKLILQEALKYYNIVINDYPDSDYKIKAEKRLGMVYYKLEQYDQAIICLAKFINDKESRKLRTYKGALYFLGKSYQKIGDITEAKKLFNRIINNFPNTKWENHAKRALAKL